MRRRDIFYLNEGDRQKILDFRKESRPTWKTAYEKHQRFVRKVFYDEGDDKYKDSSNDCAETFRKLETEIYSRSDFLTSFITHLYLHSWPPSPGDQRVSQCNCLDSGEIYI